MEAQSKKSRGLKLNPLAPAQSKRTFAFSGKTRNCIEHASISTPSLYILFRTFFKRFSEITKKGSRVWPQSRTNTPKWTLRVPKRSPRINKLSPKAPLRTKNMQNCPRRVAKWSRKCYTGVPRLPQMQERHKKMSKAIIKHENGPQSLENTQEHIDTNSQPTKQGNKWRHESANNQPNERTNTHIHTYTNKHPNNKTTRV